MAGASRVVDKILKTLYSAQEETGIMSPWQETLPVGHKGTRAENTTDSTGVRQPQQPSKIPVL